MLKTSYSLISCKLIELFNVSEPGWVARQYKSRTLALINLKLFTKKRVALKLTPTLSKCVLKGEQKYIILEAIKDQMY